MEEAQTLSCPARLFPNEILHPILLQLVDVYHRSTRYPISALLVCRTWYLVGRKILWKEVWHGRTDERCSRMVKFKRGLESGRGERYKDITTLISSTSDDECGTVGSRRLILGVQLPWNRFDGLKELSLTINQGCSSTIIGALNILVESFPPNIEHLEVRIRGAVAERLTLLEEIEPKQPWNITKVTGRLKSLCLQLSTHDLEYFLPRQWLGPCRELSSLSILVAVEPCSLTYLTEHVAQQVYTTFDHLLQAVEKGFFPVLQQGTIVMPHIKGSEHNVSGRDHLKVFDIRTGQVVQCRLLSLGNKFELCIPQAWMKPNVQVKACCSDSSNTTEGYAVVKLLLSLEQLYAQLCAPLWRVQRLFEWSVSTRDNSISCPCRSKHIVDAEIARNSQAFSRVAALRLLPASQRKPLAVTSKKRRRTSR